jgi:rubredoxin
MAKYVCTMCGYIYDEDKGIPDAGIAPGTKWEQLPDDWTCPMCGSPKSMFKKMEEPAAPKAASAPKGKTAMEIPAGEGGDRMREMTFAEMADLCSNLQRGCEKQYLTEEASLFKKLSDYYRERAEPAADAAGDRGAKRVLLWSSKVARILQSLMDRLGSEGEKFIESTKVWVCDICGFIYIGDEPPAICPVCKVPSLKLVNIQRRE